VWPEPHLIEKLRMLCACTLVRPLDVFDLLFHTTHLADAGVAHPALVPPAQGAAMIPVRIEQASSERNLQLQHRPPVFRAEVFRF
jgi:hypothetical protein